MMLDKKKRKPMWQSIVILVVGLIVMYVGSMLVQLLPAAINPILPPIVNVILAALVYGIRWLFRRYYHITINTFSGR